MKNLTLEHIAEACDGQYYGDEDKKQQCITSVTTDSRMVETGALFVPIVGARADGHDFIEAVMEAGALCTLSEVKLGRVDFPYIKVKSTLQAVKDLAEYYLEQLDIPVVGITGSVGKTSTKEMIAAVLEQKYQVLKTQGNFNNELGLPLTVFRLRESDEVAVLEMGISDFGEMSRLAKIAKPDITVITNIGTCHLENLEDRNGVLKAKTEVFDYMKSDGITILNGDDDKLNTIEEVHGKVPVFFGKGEQNTYCATDIVNRGMNGTICQIHTPSGEFAATIQIPGEHMVMNALAAAAIGERLGLTKEQIAKGIASCEALGGRNHIIRANGLTVLDDCYNANPMSMRSGIDVLANTQGRKVAILGDMGELGSDERKLHYEVGVYLEKADIDLLIAVGPLAKEMVFGAKSINTDNKIQYYQTKEDLINSLDEIIEPGDSILVKASHFMGFDEIVQVLTK
ncbi:MAG: UDP-N-acetylmuramoyl-tripeptide--D-alanyl-D-alanine ligase [Lachnospiraceae bacterium]|nr:UDP-N-acetylmuramoyl-tripeptide--D-alanyl-D-alanine ligase [Lachnospiraceae bacterium]MDD3616083.1 UDP-N-acetylmuramoyl-tripeptide--D-alanyl-D-alanine ligase [Lachnospiraceae bacterium]